MYFLIGNHLVNTLDFRPIRKRENREKIKINYPSTFALETTDKWTPIPRELFSHAADRSLHEKAVEIIELLSCVHYFAPLSTCFDFNRYIFKLWCHRASVFTWNKMHSSDDFHSQLNFHGLAEWCFSAVEEKQKDSLPRFCGQFLSPSKICLVLETGDK